MKIKNELKLLVRTWCDCGLFVQRAVSKCDRMIRQIRINSGSLLATESKTNMTAKWWSTLAEGANAMGRHSSSTSSMVLRIRDGSLTTSSDLLLFYKTLLDRYLHAQCIHLYMLDIVIYARYQCYKTHAYLHAYIYFCEFNVSL